MIENDEEFRIIPPKDVPFAAPSRIHEIAFLSSFRAALRHVGYRMPMTWKVGRIIAVLERSRRGSWT